MPMETEARKKFSGQHVHGASSDLEPGLKTFAAKVGTFPPVLKLPSSELEGERQREKERTAFS